MKASDLVQYLRADSAVGAIVAEKVHNARVPTKANGGGSDLPFVWLRRRSVERWPIQCQVPRMDYTFATWFDIECAASTADQADSLVDAVRSALDGYYGLIGTSVTPGVVVTDQEDDYVPRNLADDAGIFVDTLLVRVTEGG